MPAVDHVVVAQLRAHAGCDCLLADAEVDQPVDLVALFEPSDALLEVADAPHRGKQARGIVHAGARVPSNFCTAPTIRRGVRDHGLLEHLAVGHGRVERRDLHDRRLQRVEAVLDDVAGDDRRHRRVARRLVGEHEMAGLGHRLEDRVEVQRGDRARVDDLGLDALAGQLLGRLQRAVDHPRRRDDRHVAAGTADLRLPERHRVLAVGHVAVLERQQVVVQVDDRVVVADRRRHQALGVGRRRRDDDLEPGDAHEQRAQRSGVLARPAGGEAEPGLEHERHRDLAAGHVAKAGALVDDLIHGDEHELGHVELDNGPEAGHRRADRDPDLGRLGDRGDAHAVGAERRQEAVVLGRPEVLPEVQDALVALHLLVDALVDRCDVGEFVCHVVRSPTRRRTRAPRRARGGGS